jgi:hypothetical protein
MLGIDSDTADRIGNVWIGCHRRTGRAVTRRGHFVLQQRRLHERPPASPPALAGVQTVLHGGISCSAYLLHPTDCVRSAGLLVIAMCKTLRENGLRGLHVTNDPPRQTVGDLGLLWFVRVLQRLSRTRGALGQPATGGASASAVAYDLRRRYSVSCRDYQRQDALVELIGEDLDALDVVLYLRPPHRA